MTGFHPPSIASLPLRVGLIGTGYAARLRAEALGKDDRAKLVVIAGHAPERVEEFCQTFGATPVPSWEHLIQQVPLDLVVVSTINCDHGRIVRTALETGLHVVVEYPLCLNWAEAESLAALAKAQNKLLHVEHIELLGGVHQALKAALPEIGTVFYSRYVTLKPEHPAPQRWTYHPQQFGFPLIAALSRLHRLTDLFDAVATVSCQNRTWDRRVMEPSNPYYAACLCTAQLRFQNNVRAEVVYGKGETFWQAERSFEIHGEKGTLVMDGDQGTLIKPEGRYPLEVGGRRGLFARDTTMVLDYLTGGTPLYVRLEESLYTLKVADAAQRSAEFGTIVTVS